MFRILSVDWDYFIDASLDKRVSLFPDGGDYNPALESMIWVGHYVKPELLKIKADTDKMKQMRELIYKNQERFKSVMICNSHINAYYFSKPLCRLDKYIQVYNVDFHHDVYKYNDNLDCGNWLRFLIAENNVEGYWCRRDTSDTTSKASKLGNATLTSMMKVPFDALFVCKSGLYSPPHLDKFFIKTFSMFKDSAKAVVEEGVFNDRYTMEFKQNVEQMQQLLANNRK